MQINTISPKILFWLSASLVGMAVGCIAAVALADVHAVRHALQQLSPGTWGLVLGLSAINYALRYWRWHGAISRLTDVQLPNRQHLPIYLAGFALTTTPGKAGEMLRGTFLYRYGIPYATSTAAFLYERLLDLMVITALAFLLGHAFPQYAWFVWTACALVLTGIAILRLSVGMRILQMQGLPLANIRQKLHICLVDATRLLVPRPLVGGFALGAVAWAAEGWGLHVILQAMHAPVSLPSAIGIYALSMLAGALSFIPGGLGSAEAVMGLCLVALGCTPATALAATLACRAATLWFAVVLGAACCAWLGWRARPTGKDSERVA